MEKETWNKRTTGIKRIAVTGPESTGKTNLASGLAVYYKTVWVPEYARIYIDKFSRSYGFEDIEIIARQQIQNEEILLKKASKLLIADTELLVIMVWMEFKYKKCPNWIKSEIINREYDLYLLCNIDIPWKNDPQREHPHQRQQIFDIYKDEIESRNLNYVIVKGDSNTRFNIAVNAIDQLIL